MVWRKREIMEMAREAGDATTDARGRETFVFDCYGLEAFAELVREDEREACAKVCDELPAPNAYSNKDISMWDVTCMDCATAIRARGQA